MAAPSFVGVGAAQGGLSSISVAYPTIATPILPGDLLILCVTNKYPTNGPSTPSGWSTVSGGQSSGGAGASGVDTGAVYATVFVKTADSSDVTAQANATTVTVSVTSGNSMIASMVAYRPAISRLSTFSYACANGADNSAGTGWSITTGGNLDLAVDDLVLAVSAIDTDSATFTSEALTETGITFSAMTERRDSSTNSGDDCAIVVTEHTVTAGSANTTATYTMTGSAGTPSGTTLLLRVREVAASLTVVLDQQEVAVALQGAAEVRVEQQEVAVALVGTAEVRLEQQEVLVAEQLPVPSRYKPILWLRASDLALSDNDQITTWTDQSGQGNNATGAGATKPLYRTGIMFNGGPAVEFQALGYFTLPNLMSGATQGEIFAYVRSDGNACGLWAFGADSGANDESNYPTSGGDVRESFGKASADRSTFTPSVSITSGFRVYDVYSAANDWAALLDGTSQATDVSNTVTWTSSPRLGRARASSADGSLFDGMIAEVLVFDRKLSTTERAAVVTYFGDTYGAASITATAVSGSTTIPTPTFTSSVSIAPSVVSGSTTIPSPGLSAQVLWPAVVSSRTTTAVIADSSDAAVSDPDSAWSNDANAFDSDITGTTATVSTNGGSGANFLKGEGTDAPAGTDLVLGVLWRYYKSGTGILRVQVASDGFAEILGDVTSPATATTYTDWSELTAPSSGWTWAAVQALEVKAWRVSGPGSGLLGGVEFQVISGTPPTTTIPTPSFAAVITPSVLSGSTTIPTPTISTSVEISPSVVSGSTTIPTPVLANTPLPTVVSGSTTIDTPTVYSDVAITPSVVSGSTTIPAPTFTSDASISATVVSGSTTIPTPTFTSSVSISPSVITGTTTIPTATVTTSVHATPTVITGTTTIDSPVVLFPHALTTLGGLTGTIVPTDDRSGATVTITYPEDGDTVIDGGLTVYATAISADNTDVNINVELSEYATFTGEDGFPSLVDSDTSDAVGTDEVATLSLLGLVAGTTYYLRARAGHVDTNEWGEFSDVITIVAAEAVGEGYLYLYGSDVDDSLPYPHLWSAKVVNDKVTLVGAGFGDPQSEYGGNARAVLTSGTTTMSVDSWTRIAATGDATTDDRLINWQDDADPEHDEVIATIPAGADSSGVGVFIEIEEPS